MYNDILFITDEHYKSYPNYSRILSNGINSRLQYGLEVYDQVLEYASKYDVKTIINLGDVFDVKSKIDIIDFNEVYKRKKQAKSLGIEEIILPGNHDITTLLSLRTSSVDSFDNIATIITEPTLREINGIRFYLIPFIKEFEELLEVLENMPESDILCMHQSISGAYAGDIPLYSELKIHFLQEGKARRAKLVLLGHFHKRQQLTERISYIGTVMQHNWGEVGYDTGCMLLNSQSLTSKYLPLKSPQFKKLTKKNLESEDTRNCFVKVYLQNGNSSKIDEIRELLLKEKGALFVDFDISKNEVSSSITTDDLSSNVIEEYVKSLKVKKEDKLIEIGKQIMKGVG